MLPTNPPARASQPEVHGARFGTPPVAAAQIPTAPVIPARPASANLELSWEDLAGSTLFDQAKSVLAVIGLLALLVVGLRTFK